MADVAVQIVGAIVGGVPVIFSVLKTFAYPIMFCLRWMLVLEPASRIPHSASQCTCAPVLAAPVVVWSSWGHLCGMGCTHFRGERGCFPERCRGKQINTTQYWAAENGHAAP